MVDFDKRESPVYASKGKLSLTSPYGEREERNSYSRLIDFATGGFDEDLKAIRLQHWFYDPLAKRFLSPDSLYLENPEKVLKIL